jgi:hypothetical protein
MKNTALSPAFPGATVSCAESWYYVGLGYATGENGIAMTFECDPASPNWTPGTIGSVPERSRNSPGLVNHAIAWYVPQLHT